MSGQLVETLPGRVVGVVASVPAFRMPNAMLPYPEEADEAARATGVRERRWAEDGQTTETLCTQAARLLMQKLEWSPVTVDALVYVTQTPSMPVPSPAYGIHKELGLAGFCPAIEVNWSCAGYVYGLWLAHVLAARTGRAARVLLLVGDTTSRIVHPADRATAPLFGDAGSATAVEHSPASYGGIGGPALVPRRTKFVLGTDGTENLRLSQEPNASLRMDGAAVFNFTLKNVPPLVAETIRGENPKYLLFHQANEFMLKHLAKKCGLLAEQVPMNVSRYGNCSSASVPLLLCDMLGMEKAFAEKVAVFGYGAGWSWGGAMLDLQDLQVAEVMEVTK